MSDEIKPVYALGKKLGITKDEVDAIIEALSNDGIPKIMGTEKVAEEMSKIIKVVKKRATRKITKQRLKF